MKVIIGIVKRNMKKFFRDKATVFFSFLSVIIILSLYLFFLADVQVQSIMSSLSQIENYQDRLKDVEYLINGWLIAGLLAVNTITIPMSILSMKVEDKVSKIEDDFLSTPAKRHHIALGYIVSSWVIGIITSLIILFFGEIYIVINGGQLLTFIELIKVLGIISLSIVTFSGFCYAIIMFLKSNSQVSSINTIIGTFSGFLSGVYVPLGLLGTVGNVIKFFPLAQVAAMLREIFMHNAIDSSLQGASVETISEIKNFYGIDIIINGYALEEWHMILVVFAFMFISYFTAIYKHVKTKRV